MAGSRNRMGVGNQRFISHAEERRRRPASRFGFAARSWSALGFGVLCAMAISLAFVQDSSGQDIRAANPRPGLLTDNPVASDGHVTGERVVIEPVAVHTWAELVAIDAARSRADSSGPAPAPRMPDPPSRDIGPLPESWSSLGTYQQKAQANATKPAVTSGPASSAARQPPLGTNFQALPDNGGGFPPDTMGAAGPSHLVTMLNTQIRIQDKTGVVLAPDVSLGTFFGDPNVFDPRIQYDVGSGRWLAITGTGAFSAGSALRVAISASSNPTGTWTFYAIDADATDVNWLDFPAMGYNQTWIAVTGNMFTVSSGVFSGVGMWVIDKSTALAGGPLTVTVFPAGFDLAGGFTGFALQSCVTHGVSSALYIMDHAGFSSGSTNLLRMSQITGTGPAPVWSALPGSPFAGSGFFPVMNSFSNSTLDASQLGTSERIDSGGTRIGSAPTFRNGHIWMVHGGGLPNRTALFWYELDPVAMAATGLPIVQSGVIDGGSDIFYMYGSIAVNAANDVCIGFSRSDSTKFIEAAFTGRLATNLPDVMDPVTVLKVGEDSYIKGTSVGSGRVRWGDYSATVVDPTDDLTFWTLEEYAMVDVGPGEFDDRWGTWWGSKAPGVLEITTKFSQPPFCVCNGDLDGNGVLDNLDINIVENCRAGDCTGCVNSCDVNCDGAVDAADTDVVICRLVADPNVDCCPPPLGEDIESNIDWVDHQPNVVAADDFTSDGRPITAVRWWGSDLSGAPPPPTGGLNWDGWFVSFHLPPDQVPTQDPNAYQVDDGVQENSIGTGAPFDLLWLNQFNVLPGLETINSISVAWGSVAVGVQASVLLYDDPNNDGDPSDAVLLTSASTVTANPSASAFTTVSLADTVVGAAGDSFFVGVFLSDTVGDFPAPIDLSAPQGRSWIVGSNLGTMDLNNLLNNTLPPDLTENIGSPPGGLAGNWLVRAGARLPVTNQSEPLALYYCDDTVVDILPTPLPACDALPVEEYRVDLDTCCLVHANVDPRSGLIPATKQAFFEDQCSDYLIDIEAVVGHEFIQDPVTMECIETPTGKALTGPFWGWHTSPYDHGPAPAVQTSLKMGSGVCVGGSNAGFGCFANTDCPGGTCDGSWLYGPWQPVVSTCSAPNMAFELLTQVPNTSQDCNFNWVADQCELAGNDCQPNGIPDDCDLASGASLDTNSNGIPDECECCMSSTPLDVKIPDSVGAGALKTLTANRTLILQTVGDPGCTGQAIRVTFTDLAPPYDIWNGKQLWLGSPTAVSELGSLSDATPPVKIWSKLQCAPECRTDWASFGEIHVSHEGIVPGSVYDIQVVDCTAPGCLTEETAFSPPLTLSTAVFGDIVRDCVTDPCAPPEGPPVNVVDILAVLNAFSSAPGAPRKARADMEPPDLDRTINVSDALQVVFAFSGLPYPFAPSVSNLCP